MLNSHFCAQVSETPLFSLDDVTVKFGKTVALNQLSGTIPAGMHVGLIGPNGSGKTTLMRALYGAVKPNRGRIKLVGEPLDSLQPHEIATKIALVPQNQIVPQRVKVIDEVLLGRIPFLSAFATYSHSDYDLAVKALDTVGLTGVREKYSDQLSGGERQRTVIARALTQDTNCVLLDEPTNHLDIFYQHKVLSLLRRLAPNVVTVLHDINLAAKYCDWLLMLDHGKVFASGKPHEVLTESNIEHVYGVQATTIHHEGKLQYCFSVNNDKEKS